MLACQSTPPGPPPPPASFPSFHSRCSLATLLRLCKQPFIVNIFLVFHTCSTFSYYLIRDTCTVAYYTYSSGIEATNKTSLTQFGSTYSSYSTQFCCYLTFYLGINCKMARYLFFFPLLFKNAHPSSPNYSPLE